MLNYLPFFASWTWINPVIPAMYYEVLSPEQEILELYKGLGKLQSYIDEEIVPIVNKCIDDYNNLDSIFNEFKEHGFDDYYAKQVAEWINNNLEYIYTHTVKQIYFGLTDDGYFCAYIPDSWEDITFDTGADYDSTEYGRLILSY